MLTTPQVKQKAFRNRKLRYSMAPDFWVRGQTVQRRHKIKVCTGSHGWVSCSIRELQAPWCSCCTEYLWGVMGDEATSNHFLRPDLCRGCQNSHV